MISFRLNPLLVALAILVASCTDEVPKTRPNAGWTPSAEKYVGVTRCPQLRCERPSTETPNGTGATYASVALNTSLRSL